jgi:uncharacterized membrane protein
MFGTDTNELDPLARRKRDRRIFGGLIGLAMLAFFTLDYVGQPLVAVGAYWLFFVAAVAVVYTSDAIMDERDRALERHTSHTAVQLVGAGLIVLAPGLNALAEANVYDAPPILDGVVFGWGIVFVLWGVAYLYERSQQ